MNDKCGHDAITILNHMLPRFAVITLILYSTVILENTVRAFRILMRSFRSCIYLCLDYQIRVRRIEILK